MKRILCFGDSNTWGYVPLSALERYPEEVRWAGVLQSKLGSEYRVIEEGQNGRTTVFDDPFETICKNGSRHLPVLLESHKPLDLVLIMLGTNDLKTHFRQNAHTIAAGAGELAERVLASEAGPVQGAPKVMLIAPAEVADAQCPFGHKFDGTHETSKGFAQAYQEVAQALAIPFFSAAEHVSVPTTDCIHFDAAGHTALGSAAAQAVKKIV